MLPPVLSACSGYLLEKQTVLTSNLGSGSECGLWEGELGEEWKEGSDVGARTWAWQVQIQVISCALYDGNFPKPQFPNL